MDGWEDRHDHDCSVAPPKGAASMSRDSVDVAIFSGIEVKSSGVHWKWTRWNSIYATIASLHVVAAAWIVNCEMSTGAMIFCAAFSLVLGLDAAVVCFGRMLASRGRRVILSWSQARRAAVLLLLPWSCTFAQGGPQSDDFIFALSASAFAYLALREIAHASYALSGACSDSCLVKQSVMAATFDRVDGNKGIVRLEVLNERIDAAAVLRGANLVLSLWTGVRRHAPTLLVAALARIAATASRSGWMEDADRADAANRCAELFWLIALFRTLE